MAVMMANLYDALMAAGVDQAKAKAAAEEAASFDARIADVKERVTVLTYAVGLNVALTIAVLGILLHK